MGVRRIPPKFKQETFVTKVRKPWGGSALITVTVTNVDVRRDAPDSTAADTIRNAVEYILPEKCAIVAVHKTNGGGAAIIG
jgi:hypothetical protein